VSARVFLLSPAHSGGPRARILLNPEASFDVARRLRGPDGAPLGEVFSFLSGLYFRGKLAYARVFGGSSEPLVITAGDGLVPADTRVDAARLLAYASVAVDARDKRYLEPLLRDAAGLATREPSVEVVLLGSIASGKYVEPLLGIFGDRLVFPSTFVGRGDMSRGGLLLRAVDGRHELDYAPVRGAVRHGPRPERLTPRRRS
jgi:hypothetical protein